MAKFGRLEALFAIRHNERAVIFSARFVEIRLDDDVCECCHDEPFYNQPKLQWNIANATAGVIKRGFVVSIRSGLIQGQLRYI